MTKYKKVIFLIGIPLIAFVFVIGLINLYLWRNSLPSSDSTDLDVHDDLFFSLLERDMVLGVKISKYQSGLTPDELNFPYAISELGEIYVYLERYNSIDVFNPNGDLKEIIQSEFIGASTEFNFDLENNAIYLTNRDPINISKYSTLTNSIEYTLPATISFSDIFNSKSYELHSFKGVNSEGEALVYVENRIYDENGYFTTYEVAVINSTHEIEIIEKDAASEGELLGFDQYFKNVSQYNLIKEVKAGELELFVRRIGENGSVATFNTDWIDGGGEVIGVDKNGYIYYLKYNQDTDLKFPELFKYNRDMELIDSMDVFIPYNTGANDGAIWGEPFLSVDGVIYYSFIEPEPVDDLWSIQKFSFSDKERNEAVNPGPQTANFDSELDTESEMEWETYSDGSISFEYPSVLNLNKEVNAETTTISLTHSIDFKHADPCSGRGDATLNLLDKFEDFNVFINISNGDLENTMPEWGLAHVYSEKNVLILEPGFIDPYDTETLKGYRMMLAADGCGSFIYFFPISPDKTLMVEEKFTTSPYPTTDLNDSSRDLYSIPESVMGEDFFERIFTSIRI